ncbi:uncharacterized protein STEHIDRAFT_163362 [Stereum hirsutum FP-91666 SS1]|uniref:Hydantoinase A/oxoprolinase domain-containing protein n=1 Tax=Stereum hirsutum (strain FP-91666) TaxID=721885 RepID=R7RYB6_STEHR|nr:uncharacterized protein STEHIDRAFT_163362 [Stereum hirsutum FP-91666 SS1]EIM79803.1 hypothetical protein STEHIDRAFT_163362 [Stereum hirsutum FP-91666 SS1]
MSPVLRLGVDVGGSVTDTVLNLTHTLDSHSHDVQHKTVLASAKSPATPDVTTGIRNAIQFVLQKVPEDAKKVIEAWSIGTTNVDNDWADMSFEKAADELGLGERPVFVTSNDGTLLSCEEARRFVGAYKLDESRRVLASLESGNKPGVKGEAALVVDIGGTTPFVCNWDDRPKSGCYSSHVSSHLTLPSHFPLLTRTSSIGLGGGSLIRQDPSTGRVIIGPDSVGYRITEEALVFGGKTLTATDRVA